VIIGRKGAYRGVHYSPVPFFAIDTAFYIEPRENIDLRWAYYAFRTLDINSMDSGSAIPSTSRAEIYGLPVDVPPPAEQRAIAAILGALDDKVELNRQMNETLERLGQAMIRDSVRTWPLNRLDVVATVVMGQSPPGNTYNRRGDGPPFYQGRADFGFRYPVRRMYCSSPTRRARAGNALLSVRAPVGSLNRAEEECAIGRGVAALDAGDDFNSLLYHVLLSTRERWQVFEAEGTVFGSVGRNDVRAFQVPWPDLNNARVLNARLKSLDDVVLANTQEARALAELRDTLLPGLVLGALRATAELPVEAVR